MGQEETVGKSFTQLILDSNTAKLDIIIPELLLLSVILVSELQLSMIIMLIYVIVIIIL
jgi:hypothetical protein